MALDGFRNLGKSQFDGDKKIAVLNTYFFVRQMERVIVDVRMHVRRIVGHDISRLMYSFLERCPSAKVQETHMN
jgi:hypothetical protein